MKLFSYQCSQHSTPATIVEVFNNAKKFQESKDMKQLISIERKNTKQFVSVVVLDEVGLAEDSPSLPLKALHPLLEDGTSGADAKVQVHFTCPHTYVCTTHESTHECSIALNLPYSNNSTSTNLWSCSHKMFSHV